MVKYLVVFALVLGISLIGSAEAKEVVVDPEVAPIVVDPLVVDPAVNPVVEEIDVRIGGDVRVRHINVTDGLFGAPVLAADEDWMDIRTRLLIEADLLENVTAVVRLVNSRDWGVGELGVTMDRAFFTMANVAGHPIDLIIGRQPIALGDSMLINTTFDAVRLSIPFEPVVVDAFFAKIADAETGVVPDDDLIGFHIVYLHPDPAITVDMGWYEYIDRALVPTKESRTRSMAISASGNLLGLLSVDGGMISQTGDVEGVDLDANALHFEVGASTGVGIVSFKYASLSGDDPLTDVKEEFQPMWEWVDFSRFLEELPGVFDTNTNLNLWGLGFKTMPMPGVSIALCYTDISRDTVLSADISDDVGTEVRIRAGYALTPDVSLGFEMARFSPGAYWRTMGVAGELGYSCAMTETGHFTALQLAFSF